MNLLILTHVFLAVFMTGLCWFVQVVHYPLFQFVGKTDFPKYERKNMITGWITIPALIAESITGIGLMVLSPNIVYAINIGFLVLIATSTFLYQVPLHLQLGKRASTYKINKLIRTNWIRTISWTCRSIMLMVVLQELLK